MSESQKIIQVRSSRQVPVRVKLLDDDIFNHSVDVSIDYILYLSRTGACSGNFSTYGSPEFSVFNNES